MSNKHPNSGWTDERVERLKILHKDGLSCSMIAKDLGGVTRNAVIGKVHRLGIQHEAPTKPTTCKPYPERKAVTRRRALDGLTFTGHAKPRQQYQDRPQPTLGPIESPNAKVWTERGYGECAYPVDGEGADTRSCCNPTSGAYCAGHASVMFQPGSKDRQSDAEQRLKNIRWIEEKDVLNPRALEEWAAA